MEFYKQNLLSSQHVVDRVVQKPAARKNIFTLPYFT